MPSEPVSNTNASRQEACNHGAQSLTEETPPSRKRRLSYLVISRAESRKSSHCLPQKVSTQPKPAADLAWRVPILFFAEHTNSAANISLEAAVRSGPNEVFSTLDGTDGSPEPA